MAAQAEISQAMGSTGQTGKVKLPLVMLCAVVMLGVFIAMAAVAGGVYFLMQSGKLPLGAAAGGTGTGVGTGGAGHPMVLEPILVNLADEGGHAYLRLGLTLDIEGDIPSPETTQNAANSKDTKTPSVKDLAVRDTVLAVLGKQTSAWLLGPDGKEHLKIELKEALATHNVELKVRSVYFTDFLVQI